jgi:hypothetical protein
VNFVKWENIQRKKFEDMGWVLGRMVVLSKGLSLQQDAREAITAYGDEIHLDVDQLCLSFREKDCSQALSIEEYRDEDDDEYAEQVDAEDKVDDEAEDVDEDEVEVGAEDKLDDKAEDVDEDEDEDESECATVSVVGHAHENVVAIHAAETEASEASAVHLREQVKTSLSHFTEEVCKKVISPLSGVFERRIVRTPVSSESFFPLTSRSVERVFSSWKRLMNRNAGTKPCTMHALVLLAPFELAYTINMLQHSPLTDTITNYLKRIQSQNPEKELDSKSYFKLLGKRNMEHKTRQLTTIFTDLRKRYTSISGPASGRKSISTLWTMNHSKEYFAAVGLSVPNLKKMSANDMRDRVLHHSGNAQLASNPLAILPPIDQQQAVTHVPDVDDDTFAIESVVAHRKINGKNAYKYQVKWVGYEKLSNWMPETDFVGLTLCDYWKQLVHESGGLKQADENKKIKHTIDSNEDMDEDGDSYIIVRILDHELSMDGTMFYKVLWAGEVGGTDWLPEFSFDNDVILSNYWKSYYLELE